MRCCDDTWCDARLLSTVGRYEWVMSGRGHSGNSNDAHVLCAAAVVEPYRECPCCVPMYELAACVVLCRVVLGWLVGVARDGLSSVCCVRDELRSSVQWWYGSPRRGTVVPGSVCMYGKLCRTGLLLVPYSRGRTAQSQHNINRCSNAQISRPTTAHSTLALPSLTASSLPTLQHQRVSSLSPVSSLHF